MKAPHNVHVCIACCAGIIIAALTLSLPLAWLLAGILLAAAGTILNLYGRAWDRIFLICCILAGGFWFSMSRVEYHRQLEYNQTFHQEKIAVSGTIVSRPRAGRTGYWFVIRPDDDGPVRKDQPRGRLIGFVKEVHSDDWYGRRVKVEGRFQAIAAKSRGIPDYSEIEKITGLISIPETPVFQTGFGLPFPSIWADRVRQKLTRFGATVLEPVNLRLLHGIVFGDPLADEDSRFLNNLRRTSTIHLLSVSGMHVGFIALTINFLLGLCRLPKRLRIIPLGGGVWFYIMMTGMDPPTLRAGIMLMIVQIADLLRVSDLPLNRLSLAALTLLIINPCHLFDLSFQLTFAATFGVSCLYPLLEEYFPARRKYSGLLWKALLASLSAQLMIAPLLVDYFQLISWIAPLANIILIIPGEIAVIGGLAGETLGNFWPWLGRQVLTAINFLLNLMRGFINYSGELPWAASWSPSWPWPWLIGYYLGLALLLDALRPNLLDRRQRQFKAGPVALGVLVFLNLLVWTNYFNYQGDYLQIVFLDVGQGDAIVIKAPNGRYTMVDGGDVGRGRRVILPYLRQNGILRLERVFLTHYHRDHWGGIIEVLKEVSANTVFLPPPGMNQAHEAFAAAFDYPLRQRRTVAKGMSFELGKGANLEVLEVPDLESENDRSVVLLINFGKIRLLLTGDLSFKGEELLLEGSPYRLRAALLKVGHHGSDYASGVPFLTQIKPGLAMISVGADNRYGHPGSATLNRLRSLGAKVFRTDYRGIIDCRVYRERILIRTTKDGKR